MLRNARYFASRGALAVSRSFPLSKALDDTMVALFQNGAPIMPSNGYPGLGGRWTDVGGSAADYAGPSLSQWITWT